MLTTKPILLLCSTLIKNTAKIHFTNNMQKYWHNNRNHTSKRYNSFEVITEQLSNSEQLHKSFLELPDTPEYAESWAICSQVLQDYSPVVHNAPDIVEQNSTTVWYALGGLQNVRRSKYKRVQISETSELLTASPWLFWYNLNLEPSSAEMILKCSI